MNESKSKERMMGLNETLGQSRQDRRENRAAVGSHYYTVMLEGEGSWMVQKVKERGDAFDDACHASGNYYISLRSARSRVASLRRDWEREYERTHGKRPRQFNRRNYKNK